MQEDEGVCGVRVERKGGCVCGKLVQGGEDGQMERDYAVATVDILQGVVVNARLVEVFSVEMEGGSCGNGLRNGVCVNNILEMCRENGVLREGYRARVVRISVVPRCETVAIGWENGQNFLVTVGSVADFDRSGGWFRRMNA